jgi:uncharacterized membrane protein YkoI
MMNTSTSIHQESALWATAAATGGLTEPELQAWSDHIAACPACKQLNEEELAMADLIHKTLDPHSPDAGFEQRILSRLHKARPGNGNRWYEILLFHPGLTAAAACVAIVAIAGIGSLVHSKPQPSVASAVPPSLDGLPPAVRDAIQSQANGKTVSKIERGNENGEVIYTVATKSGDGRESDFTVAGDGTLLSADTTLADVPQDVRNAIQTQAGQSGLKGVGKSFDEDGTNYVAAITSSDGREHNFTFAKDGTLLDVETALSELPAPVQTAIKSQVAHVDGGHLASIEKILDDGETNYVAIITTPRDGHGRNFTFAQDGTLTEIETPFAELPAPIQFAIKDRVGQDHLDGVNKTFDAGETHYVATITSREGAPHDFTFREDGTLASMEVTPAELPGAIKTAIHEQLGQGKLIVIDKTFDYGETTYDATMTTPDGRRRDFSLSADGKLLTREVVISETPAAVQQTISRTLGKGKVVAIDLSFNEPDNTVPYEIEGSKDGKPFYFLVSPTGDLLSMEN